MTEMALRDGRFLRLNGPRLALLRPDGSFERSCMLNQIVEYSNPSGTWEVFLRLWTTEELTLLASSTEDTDQIVQWAQGAPRLKRRASVQRAILKRRARNRIISGGVSLFFGVTVLVFTYQLAHPGGYYLVPIGAIGFGSIRLFTGLIYYVTN